MRMWESPKHQHPRSREALASPEDPNPKLQAPEKHQAPIVKSAALFLELRCLELLWSLDVGAWSLTRRRGVCHHPRDGCFQLFQLHRLGQIFRKAGFQAFADIRVHAKTADRDSADGAHGAEIAKKIHAVAVGQTDIADEKVE